MFGNNKLQTRYLAIFFYVCLFTCASSFCWALPAGYLKRTIPLNAPPIGLSFDASGILYALEGSAFGSNLATLRVINPDGTFGTDIPVVGNDPSNFFVGSMTYDPVSDSLLITDNTADGRLYSVSKTGTQLTLATGIPAIASVAVRSTGEIFVSTALGDNLGDVRTVDRTTGGTTSVASGIDFGAGLAFDSSGDLFVQDSDAVTFAGRIQKLPITDTGSGLTFGSLMPLISNMQSSAAIVFDSEDDLFATGSGGIYSISGVPISESVFDTKGTPSQFATAIAFDAAAQPFEPLSGPDGGRLAVMADFGFVDNDTFVTLFEPLPPEDADFNGDTFVDDLDLGLWQTNYGLTGTASPGQGDANGDKTVDGTDFLIWQRQAEGGGGPESLPVPEPTTAVLFGMALASTVLVRVPRYGV